jgi:DNA polymerase-3 subunit epsilon
VRPLAELPVLLLDAQATAADPERGALLEIGWAQASASEGELAAARVAVHVVAAPPGATVPAAVARLTGLRTPQWERGTAPALVWERLLRAAARVAPAPAPVVIHFARFEEPFLRTLHARHGSGPFPFEVVCSHAVARRLLPELPRRTLRSLAGYFGAAVPPLRRSVDHVVATALVWRQLAALLASEGVGDLGDLRAWLARPARRCPRRFPLPRERRQELPDRPGVYRLLRTGGAVLYVGKAGSLRQRVNGHFHAGAGERALDMLTQARDVSCTETETALEAALLETDEIKRLAPPFNVALAADGRSIWFATRDLCGAQEGPDREHAVGPLASPAPVEAFSALRAALATAPSAPLAVRARAVGVERAWAPSPECFAEGLLQLARRHGPLPCTRDLLKLGALLWAQRLAPEAPAPEPEGATTDAPRRDEARRPAWDAERVRHALEETLVRATHAVRRARWLVRLSECSLAWAEPGSNELRLLVVERGAVADRAYLAPGARLPVPPGHARSLVERRATFDVATFDRLRVLTTELRTLVKTAASLELRLGAHARLSGRRLQTALRWV